MEGLSGGAMVRWDYGHAAPGLDLRLSLQHGDEVGIGFRSYLDSRTNLLEAGSIYIELLSSQSDLPPQINKDKWHARLLYDVERSGLLLQRVRFLRSESCEVGNR